MENEKMARYKLILFGDERVGKTSLVERYVNDKFEENYIRTLGYNVYEKRVPCGNYIVSLMIYDIGGQEKFVELRKKYAQGAHTALIVFDVTNEKSYERVNKWVQELNWIVGTLPFIIIGNKIDLIEQRTVETYTGDKLSNNLGAISYIETSAKSGENVEMAFNQLAIETLRTHIKI